MAGHSNDPRQCGVFAVTGADRTKSPKSSALLDLIANRHCALGLLLDPPLSWSCRGTCTFSADGRDVGIHCTEKEG